MGAGYAQVGLLLLLTVVGLPLFFFGLMAALDRFERAISTRPGVAAAAAAGAPVAEPLSPPEPQTTGNVVSLPLATVPLATVPLATGPLAAGASAAAMVTGKSAAAI